MAKSNYHIKGLDLDKSQSGKSRKCKRQKDQKVAGVYSGCGKRIKGKRGRK